MSVSSQEPYAPTSPVGDVAAWQLFVFRKHRESLPTPRLIEELRRELRQTAGGAGSGFTSLMDALVRAGEIETGLEDAESQAAGPMTAVVDRLAEIACDGTSMDRTSLSSLVGALDCLDAPAVITCSHPEGFSYYGLNPLDFADLASRMAPGLSKKVAVIGIRSVGSTLSAIVAAQLRARGIDAERITVRPGGEPYRRVTILTPQQRDWLCARLDHPCDFLVVDEGPGFSGSTFLSAARALEENGVPFRKIVLMGSRPFPSHAAGREQARAWSRFRSCVIDYASHTPYGAGRSLGDGAWRELLYPNRQHWPACWVEQERIKHASSDGKTFFKFEGFGRFGRMAREQAEQLAQAGMSPRCLDFDQGFGCYEFVRGRPLTASEVSEAQLSHMAEYCAFRRACFPAPGSDSTTLADMARQNLEVEFEGRFRGYPMEVPLEHPVYPDCRMHPHEWLVSESGPVLKADAVGHAEGHQLPGPADIAWDLAGTIVEWELSSAATDFFLEEYRRRSGDAVRTRLGPYLILYSVFRMAQCRLSSISMAHRREAKYLRRQYENHARRVYAMLQILQK